MGIFQPKPKVWGFQPYGTGQAGQPVLPKEFPIAAGDNGIGVCPGDLIKIKGSGSNLAAATITAGPYDGSSNDLLGVVAYIYDAYGNLISGIRGNENLTAGRQLTAGKAGKLGVWDPRAVEYYSCNEDGDSEYLTAADVGLNVAVIAAAGNSDGYSGFKLDSSSSAATSTLPFTLFELHRDDSTTEGTAVRLWIVKANHSFFKPGSTGVS